MRFSMVAAIFLAALGTVVQRFILNQIDVYTKGWFFGGATNNSSSSESIPGATPDPVPGGSCSNDLPEGGVRVATEAGFYYLTGMSVVLMLVWVGLWFNRRSTLKHEHYIAWQRDMRGDRETETQYWVAPDHNWMSAVGRPPTSIPRRQRSSTTPQYLKEEPTCADQCASFLAKQLGGWPGFLLFASLATASFLYADTFRTYEQVVVQRGGMVDWIKSYLYSMPQKAAEVEGWKWATSLAFNFVSGLVRDWWYDIAKGSVIPVAGYTANVMRKTLLERKITKTAKQLNIPADMMDGQHAALRREVSSSAAAAARFRSSRDPQTAQPLKGLRKVKSWITAKAKSFVHSAKGRALTPAPTTSTTRQHDPVGYALFTAAVAPKLDRPFSAGTMIAEDSVGEHSAPGPAPSAPPLSEA